MAENESIKITQLPSATVTEDGDYLVFSTETNTFKIKVKDFMVHGVTLSIKLLDQ